MAKVTNLKIELQTGGNNTHYATWKFVVPPASDSSGGIAVGDLVTINSRSATYYNGVAISEWVFPLEWYVSKLTGSRAVLGADSNGLFNIVSPIDVKWLTKVSGSSGGVEGGVTDTLDHYEVKWSYDSGNGVWFSGSSGNVDPEDGLVATYNAPSNAIKIQVSVKPVAKTHKVGNNEVEYWTGTATTATYAISGNPPETPSSAPKVVIEKYKLTASLENISDARTDRIEFQVYDGTDVFASGTAEVKACRASYAFDVKPGGEYTVRCRAINLDSHSNAYSDWTQFTSSEITIPDTVSAFTAGYATSETTVYLEWEAAPTATSYDIEYTTDINKFDNSDEPTKKTGITFNHFEVSGLEPGHEYFFRVRAVNAKGESAWSESILQTSVGTTPTAPTTWSSSTTVVTGEPLILYWVHNCEDNSDPTYADIQFFIKKGTDSDFIEQPVCILKYEDIPDPDVLNAPPYQLDTNIFEVAPIVEYDDGSITSITIDTTEFDEGSTIEWRVRTAGVVVQKGDYSIKRTVKIYAPPVFTSYTSIPTVTSFPINFAALAGPNTQKPIGYHVTVTSNESYETVDNIGNPRNVTEGEVIYSKYFDINSKLEMQLTPADIDLADGQSYTLSCTASMDSGLSVEKSQTFAVRWNETVGEPDLSMMVDTRNFVTHLRPTYNGSSVTLSVYRREYDGKFTLIADRLDGNTFVTDPHPALDYARYRVIATSNVTGAIGYYDAPGYPMGGKAVIIQWDEAWSKFDVWSEDEFEQPVWNGSMLRLPYNIDVSESNDLEVSFVNYIGREHPVSYYGTQVGETASWSVSVPKSDKDTIYALRRLAKWKGDVYVREPSGVGYWAHIKVSFSQKHADPVVPVSMEITRVEGGM